MKMRIKTKLYLFISIAGLLAVLASKLFFGGQLSKTQSGIIIGIGAGLFGLGFSKWQMCRWEEKNPDMMKQNRIEENDERNRLIRLKSQALTGTVLQWIVMAGAWISIILNAPLWITICLISAFLLKTILDLAIMAYYQRKI